MDSSPAPQKPKFMVTISPDFRDLDLTRDREIRHLQFRISCDKPDDSGNIAIMEGHLVNRALAEEAGFGRTMEDINTGCSLTLATVIFDEYGQLQQKWFLGTRKGSSIWDARVNIGSFLIIDSVIVEEQYRRKGFGKHLVFGFLRYVKDYRIGISYVFTNLGELEGAARIDAIAFWRATGFKRIGLSHVFCYAMSMSDRSKIPDAEKEDLERDTFDSEASYSTEDEISSPAQSVESEPLPESLSSGRLNELEEPQLAPFDDDSALKNSSSPSPPIDEEASLAELDSPNVQSSHTSIGEPNMTISDRLADFSLGHEKEDSEEIFGFSP
ncbi:hypothetical protein BOTCAL_0002g00390 [Botryotinia calthae]|uniref:N-acetyltransferase domain-containing protein n=1 Tax=Botryotinia calthae TaxID=38488 RepID=A0A4Y8DI56_9HELO|nr:hypothetical protein BOTCAL_0002g00390 [Botryotinia calthae]